MTETFEQRRDLQRRRAAERRAVWVGDQWGASWSPSLAEVVALRLWLHNGGHDALVDGRADNERR